jgi:hypothetical protein
MAHWTDTRTKAQGDLKKALKVVDDTLSFTKDSVGKPSKKERALFAAAIAFAYGVWENYVEQLAIELATKLAEKLAPEKVPERIRKSLEKNTAWELTVSPGWRHLWIEKVREKAIGNGADKFGLNTAKAGQVQDLLAMAGVKGALEAIPQDRVPQHLKHSVSSVTDAVNQLVELRGEIVHTGSVPDSLRKAHVREWREFVEKVASDLDAVCRKQCKKLYGS